MNNNLPASELIIRPASFTDIPHIQLVAYETWPVTYTSIVGKEQVEYMLKLMYSKEALEKQMENNHHFFMALKGYKPVGFASFSYIEREVYKLQKLYVLPSEQKAGVGKKLLQTVEEIAKSMGADKLQLNVNRNNPAKSLYERFQYHVIKTEDIDIGQGFFMNDFIMEKAL